MTVGLTLRGPLAHVSGHDRAVRTILCPRHKSSPRHMWQLANWRGVLNRTLTAPRPYELLEGLQHKLHPALLVSDRTTRFTPGRVAGHVERER
jgi:hypothetical protein